MILLFDFNSWWDSLNTLTKIYWIITIPFTILFVIQLILSFLGGDSGVDESLTTDAQIEADHGLGFHFFTFKNMVAFFTIFGWSGLTCIQNDLSTTLTILISIISGLIMMFIMASIFYFMSKLIESGNINVNNAVGKNCNVYLTIPAKRQGKGKVHVIVQSQLREFDAITDDEMPIKSGDIAKCIKIEDNNVLVVTKK